MSTRKQRQKRKKRAALERDKDLLRSVKHLKKDNHNITQQLVACKQVIKRLRVIQRLIYLDLMKRTAPGSDGSGVA